MIYIRQFGGYMGLDGGDDKVRDFPLRGFMEYWWVDTKQAELIAKEGRLGDGTGLFEEKTLVCRADMSCGGMEREQEQSDGEVEREHERI